MQPIDPKDRPKVMLVAAAATVAMGSTAWNLFRSTARADSKPTATAAMTPMPIPNPVGQPSAATPAAAAAGATDAGATAGAGPAGETGSLAAAASTAEEAEPAAAAEESFEAAGWPKVRDPFRPLPAVVAEAPAAPATPAPAAPPAARRRSPVPVLPAVQVASRVEVREPVPVRPEPAQSAPATDPEPQAQPAAEPTVTVTLVGTVGYGRSAVAVVRMGDETLYVRPAQVLARWHVRRIGDGQVSFSRNEQRYTVNVGDTFTMDSQAIILSAEPSQTDSTT